MAQLSKTGYRTDIVKDCAIKRDYSLSIETAFPVISWASQKGCFTAGNLTDESFSCATAFRTNESIKKTQSPSALCWSKSKWKLLYCVRALVQTRRLSIIIFKHFLFGASSLVFVTECYESTESSFLWDSYFNRFTFEFSYFDVAGTKASHGLAGENYRLPCHYETCLLYCLINDELRIVYIYKGAHQRRTRKI